MYAVALEDGMLAHLHFDVEIAGRSAVAPGFALSGQPHAIAGIHAGRDFHREFLAAPDPALPQTVVAGVAHDAPAAPAMRTGLLQREEALRDAHLPGAAAGIAGDRIAAACRTATMAHLAFHELVDVDLDGAAEHRLREVQGNLIAQIRAAEYLRGTPPA